MVTVKQAQGETLISRECSLHGEELSLAEAIKLTGLGMSALHKAAREGDVDKLKDLLSNSNSDDKIDVNERDSLNRTALHLCSWSDNCEGINLLCNAGCDVHAAAQDETNALHFAAMKGNVECAKILIDAGLRVNAKNRRGMNALLLASSNQHKDMVEMLLQHNANPLSRNKKQKTARDLAATEDIKKTLEEAEAKAKEKNKAPPRALKRDQGSFVPPSHKKKEADETLPPNKVQKILVHYSDSE
eukprot:jgi/Picsp_1/6586/NSC_03929-R1_protein